MDVGRVRLAHVLALRALLLELAHAAHRARRALAHRGLGGAALGVDGVRVRVRGGVGVGVGVGVRVWVRVGAGVRFGVRTRRCS